MKEISMKNIGVKVLIKNGGLNAVFELETKERNKTLR